MKGGGPHSACQISLFLSDISMAKIILKPNVLKESLNCSKYCCELNDQLAFMFSRKNLLDANFCILLDLISNLVDPP